MPSPIAHSVTGYVLAGFLDVEQPKALIKHRWNLFAQMFYPIFVATAADLDFAIEFVMGSRFHRGPTHSFFFAAGFSLICALVFARVWKASFKHTFWFTLAIYGSHLFLDYFTYGGQGMKLLWPLSQDYFKSPISIFPPVHHSRGIFDPSHLEFILFELIYSVLLLGALRLWRGMKSRKEVSE